MNNTQLRDEFTLMRIATQVEIKVVRRFTCAAARTVTEEFGRGPGGVTGMYERMYLPQTVEIRCLHEESLLLFN